MIGRAVLVTGATGFIGSHLVEELVKLGAKVRVFVRYTSTGYLGMLHDLRRDILDEIDFIYGDLRDYGSVAKAIDGMEIIFHLGAVISIPYSYHNPREVVEVNVLGTLNILEAMRERVVNARLIHISTSEVYGSAKRVPMDETHPRYAQSPYAASKTGADELTRSYIKSFGIYGTIVRPFNTFGPRQSIRAVTMSIITQGLTTKKVKIGNTKSIRDFTYVRDTVKGLIQSASTEETIGEEFNLGTGKGITISSLIDTIGKILGKPLITETETERIRPPESEVDRLISNPSKAVRLIGWNPEVTLEKGLELTVDWVKEKLSQPEWRFWFEGSSPGWR